tara:strand:+ start:977 stop:1360 length:384 start_codon:yes stop_codon:yes gene_type:complete
MIDQRLVLAKELGRRPTEKEIGQRMQEMIASHDKLKHHTKINKVVNHHSEKAREEANKHRRQTSIQASPRVRTINILIHYNLNAKQIANALNLTVRTVRDTIHRYKLPREEVKPIKGKCGHKDIVGI